jgi:protein-S-isoprenylcysteine O-methyltransferase Ste14
MNARLGWTRLLLVPVVVLALFSHHLHPEGSGWDRALSLSGLVLLLGAMGGRIWAGTYLAGRKNRVLVTEGPYSIVRNPLYLFSFLGFIGAGLAFESVTLALLMGLVFVAAHFPTMLAEERHLAQLFGEEYESYRARVPRFVPRLRGMQASETLVLDMRRFRASLRDCLAIPLVFILADLLEWTKLEGILPVLIHLP